MSEWQTVEAPRGAYIGWGNTVGQTVQGEVIFCDMTGGTNVAGEPVPELQLRLTERAASFTKEGQRTDYEPGEYVVLTCSQISLKRHIMAAQPPLGPGWEVRVWLSALSPTGKGTVKEFLMEKRRVPFGAGSSPQPAPSPASMPAQTAPAASAGFPAAPASGGQPFSSEPPF